IRRTCRWRAAIILVLGGASFTLAACSPPPAQVVKKYDPPDERFVFFSLGKADVLSDGFFSIGYVTALLESDPSLSVLVVGHADPRGRAETSRELSFKRARAVRKVLVEHGVKDSRIVIASPKEQNESSLTQLARRADLYVYDPVREDATKRVGYAVEIKND